MSETPEQSLMKSSDQMDIITENETIVKEENTSPTIIVDEDDLFPNQQIDLWKLQLQKNEKPNFKNIETTSMCTLSFFPEPIFKEIALPNEIAIHIIFILGSNDNSYYTVLKHLASLSLVSRNTNEFSNSNLLWNRLCKKFFPGSVAIRDMKNENLCWKEFFRYMKNFTISPTISDLYYELSLSSYSLINIDTLTKRDQLQSVVSHLSFVCNLITQRSPNDPKTISLLKKLPQFYTEVCIIFTQYQRENTIIVTTDPREVIEISVLLWRQLQHFIRALTTTVKPLIHLYGHEPIIDIFLPDIKQICYDFFSTTLFMSYLKDPCLHAIDQLPINEVVLIKPMLDYYKVENNIPSLNDISITKIPTYVNLQPNDSNQKICCEVELLKGIFYIERQLEDIGLCHDEDVDDTAPYPLFLPVTLKVTMKILEFCKLHKNSASDDSLLSWIGSYDQSTIFEIILGANVLDFKPLLDLSCRCVANMIKGKSPEEIRKTFNIKNDFTPEEEERVRKENEWCEEVYEEPSNKEGETTLRNDTDMQDNEKIEEHTEEQSVEVPSQQPDPIFLQQLIDMGYYKADAEFALLQSGNKSIEDALLYLS